VGAKSSIPRKRQEEFVVEIGNVIKHKELAKKEVNNG